MKDLSTKEFTFTNFYRQTLFFLFPHIALDPSFLFFPETCPPTNTPPNTRYCLSPSPRTTLFSVKMGGRFFVPTWCVQFSFFSLPLSFYLASPDFTYQQPPQLEICLIRIVASLPDFVHPRLLQLPCLARSPLHPRLGKGICFL